MEDELSPALVVVDSIQAVADPAVSGPARGPSPRSAPVPSTSSAWPRPTRCPSCSSGT